MKALLQYFPAIVLLYFAGFKHDNLAAAQWGLVASVVCYAAIALTQKGKLDKTQWGILGLTVVMCGLTMWLKDDRFIRLKAPVLFMLQALAVFVSPYFGKQPKSLAERFLATAFTLSPQQWYRVNFSWGVFFVVCAAANAFVAFQFPLYWAQFKVFGSTAMMITFMLIQFYVLRAHINQEPATKN